MIELLISVGGLDQEVPHECADSGRDNDTAQELPLESRGFYAFLAIATLIGLGLNFTPINPIKALFWTAVINGVVAVPMMVAVMPLSANKQVMGEFVISSRLRALGWLATAVMLAAAVGLFATWGQS